jgi:hypothetical protein
VFEILSICKGGGYRYCRTNPPHPNRNSKGLYPLHRVLMEIKLGRLLERSEDVHHKDEDKTNDHPDNLELKTGSDHAKHHASARAPKGLEFVCRCGKEFTLKPYQARVRLKRSQSGHVHCSRKCGRKKWA